MIPRRFNTHVSALFKENPTLREQYSSLSSPLNIALADTIQNARRSKRLGEKIRVTVKGERTIHKFRRAQHLALRFSHSFTPHRMSILLCHA